MDTQSLFTNLKSQFQDLINRAQKDKEEVTNPEDQQDIQTAINLFEKIVSKINTQLDETTKKN